MINLFLTYDCNLSCKHCYVGDRDKTHMLTAEDIEKSLHFIEKVFKKDKETEDDLIKIGKIEKRYFKREVTLNGGEISIVPDLEQIVQIFANNDIKVNLFTNAVFAEKNIINSDYQHLSNQDLSNLLIRKMNDLLESNLFEGEPKEFLIENIKSKNKLVDEAYGLYPLGWFVQDINDFIIQKNFYDWANNLNKHMTNGENVIDEIIVGEDIFHYKDRIRRGYTGHGIFNSYFDIQHEENGEIKTIPLLEKKLSPIKLKKSSGRDVLHVGNLKNQKNFYEKGYSYRGDQMNKKVEENMFFQKTRKEIMEYLYRTNFQTIFRQEIDVDSSRYITDAVNMGHCFFREIKINPNREISKCSLANFPHAYENERDKDDSYVMNPDFADVLKAFWVFGGPLGIARMYGMNEKDVYETFMHKGPCGLCVTALEYKEKNNLTIADYAWIRNVKETFVKDKFYIKN